MLALDPRAGVHALEAERAGHADGAVGERVRAVRRARLEQRGHEPRQQRGAARIVVAQQRDGAVEEADLAGEVAARVRRRGRRREPLARPRRELGRDGGADLAP